MPITSKVFPSQDLTIFTCNGEISFHEIVETMERFYEGIDSPPTKKVLWNLTNATTGPLSLDKMGDIANLSLENEGVMRGGKTAIVAPRDIDFGLARMFASQTAGSHRELMVFRALNGATEWIEKELNETL